MYGDFSDTPFPPINTTRVMFNQGQPLVEAHLNQAINALYASQLRFIIFAINGSSLKRKFELKLEKDGNEVVINKGSYLSDGFLVDVRKHSIANARYLHCKDKVNPTCKKVTDGWPKGEFSVVLVAREVAQDLVVPGYSSNIASRHTVEFKIVLFDKDIEQEKWNRSQPGGPMAEFDTSGVKGDCPLRIEVHSAKVANQKATAVEFKLSASNFRGGSYKECQCKDLKWIADQPNKLAIMPTCSCKVINWDDKSPLLTATDSILFPEHKGLDIKFSEREFENLRRGDFWIVHPGEKDVKFAAHRLHVFWGKLGTIAFDDAGVISGVTDETESAISESSSQKPPFKPRKQIYISDAFQTTQCSSVFTEAESPSVRRWLASMTVGELSKLSPDQIQRRIMNDCCLKSPDEQIVRADVGRIVRKREQLL